MHDLNRYTPAGALNRDETLLAIGRASAKPNRLWKLLCAGLLLSHVIIVGVVWWTWPRPTLPVAVEPVPQELPAVPYTAPDPSSVLVLSQGLDRIPNHAGEMLSHPVLRAGSSTIE
jgi:hypothetical protein